MSSRSLQIDEDLEFQRRQLRVSRAAIFVFGVIAIAATLGYLGPGPLGYATAEDAEDRISVHYERFLDFGTPTELVLEVQASGEATTIGIQESYLEGFDLDYMLPEPDSQSTDDGQVLFTFSSGPPNTMTIALTPREAGLQRGEVSIRDGGSASVDQVVYP